MLVILSKLQFMPWHQKYQLTTEISVTLCCDIMRRARLSWSALESEIYGSVHHLQLGTFFLSRVYGTIQLIIHGAFGLPFLCAPVVWQTSGCALSSTSCRVYICCKLYHLTSLHTTDATWSRYSEHDATTGQLRIGTHFLCGPATGQSSSFPCIVFACLCIFSS